LAIPLGATTAPSFAERISPSHICSSSDKGWTPLRSLLLDDPVQHIDDFRALHLVEVLAALRLDGRQIICAVEDPALAHLLCRRLVSTVDKPGRRYDIDMGPEGATSILTGADVPPMPVDVLRGGLQASTA
jgi:hypothetical protein